MAIMRGEIYFVHLDPAFGREIGGYKARPVLVVSINKLHASRIITVVPGTTTPSEFENVVPVEPSKINGLSGRTFFQCNQLRAIDQGRMTGRAVGRMEAKDMVKIEETIRFCLGLLKST